MGRKPVSRFRAVAIVAALAGASGCAGHEARDFSGRWTPANQYAETPEAIPLAPATVFQASPMDGTLRAVLARWARDSEHELDYRHPYDYTLHAPVRDVHATDLGEALSQLATAYRTQGVVLVLEGRRLVVTEGVAPGG